MSYVEVSPPEICWILTVPEHDGDNEVSVVDHGLFLFHLNARVRHSAIDIVIALC